MFHETNCQTTSPTYTHSDELTSSPCMLVEVFMWNEKMVVVILFQLETNPVVEKAGHDRKVLGEKEFM